MGPEEKRRLAQLRLRSRRRRDGELRRRALALSLGLFALVWVAVFGQMASGHDPALKQTSASASRATVSRSAQHASGSSGEQTRGDDSQISGSTAVAPATTATPTPVVTSQS